MKVTNYKFLAIALVVMISSAGCGISDYDNYDEPSANLEGQIVYDGNPIHVRSTAVELELWQPGYADDEKIPAHVDQDGSFSSTLFNGSYKLTQLAGSGPWVTNTDTIDVEVNGNTSIEVQVEPYYLLQNVSIESSGGTVEANFEVNQINSSLDLEYAALYIGTGTIVDSEYNEQSVIEDGNNITFNSPENLELDLSGELAERDDIFVRVGVKTAGKEDLLYSEVVNVSL